LGASGSGKSTILQLLNYLQSPTSGELLFNDNPYHTYAPERLRQQIALVPQESKLLGMTVQAAINYPLTLQKLSKAEIQRRWLYWQEMFEVPEMWLDRHEALLSGGQKQWVAIARALMMEPQILLLDEPTAALDLGRSQKLAETLILDQQNSPRPIAIATHELEFAQHLATKIIYLENGKIISQGDRETIDWEMIRTQLRASVSRNNSEDW
jgi:D-methionine transport system ATP-binding protein